MKPRLSSGLAAWWVGAAARPGLHRGPALLPASGGALALAVALGLGGVLAPRWEAEAAAESQALAHQRLRAAPTLGIPAAAATEPLAGAALAATWPASAESPARAVQLDTLARRQGLRLQQVREQLDAAEHLQLGMTGRASYAALRRFVERALAGDPALVLDRVRLQRTAVDEAELSFELQWTLLHRAEPGDAARARGSR